LASITSIKDIEDYLEIQKKYPIILENVDLISDNKDSSIKHLVKIIKIAIEIEQNEGSVWLIEACNVDGVKMFEDIDLIFDLGGKTYCCDVTNMPGGSAFIGDVRNVSFGSSKIIKQKTTKIKSFISSYDLMCDYVILDIETEDIQVPEMRHSVESSMNSDDFNEADNLIDEIQNMTVFEAKTFLESFIANESKEIESDPNHLKFFRNDFCLKKNESDQALLKENIQAMGKNSDYIGTLMKNKERFPDSSASLIDKLNFKNLKPRVKFPRFEMSTDLKEDRDLKMMRILKNSDHHFANELSRAMEGKSKKLTCKRIVFKAPKNRDLHSSNLLVSDTVYKVKFVDESESLMGVFKREVGRLPINSFDHCEEMMAEETVKFDQKQTLPTMRRILSE